jgi:hypothetical protein
VVSGVWECALCVLVLSVLIAEHTSNNPTIHFLGNL